MTEEYTTPIAFKVLTDSTPVTDGAGRVYIALQAERKDADRTKYCKVVRRIGAIGSESFEDVCEVAGIYCPPHLMVRPDGGCTVSGLSRDKKTEVRKDVPGFVPVPTLAALMAKLALLEARLK